MLVVARLIERKGIAFLIEALPVILKEDDRVRLTIIGEGNLEEKLKSLAKRQGVADKVTFMGFREHNRMPKYYNKAQLFILPSKNEGMSNTILEAMACGLPIITTRTGGTGELIKGNGILVPVEDSQAIARAVLKIMAEPQSRKKMAEKSRQIALEFSWRKQAMKYVDIYKSLCKGG